MGTIIGSVFRDSLCAEFNNGVSNEYAYVDDPSFKTDTQGAFSFWYRPIAVLSASGLETVIGYGVRSGSNDSMLTFRQRYNGSASIAPAWRNQPIPDINERMANAGTTNLVYGQYIFSAATWRHVVWQSNGSAYALYIDGALITVALWAGSAANTGNWLGDMSGTQHRLAFGAHFQSNAPLQYNDCRQNEIAYFNRALTGTEVTWLYNGGVPRNPRRGGFGTDLKSWWRMGDSPDTGSTLYDQVGSNNLTLVNMDASNYVAP